MAEHAPCIFSTFNQTIEEYRESLSHYDLRLRQLSRGIFRGHSLSIMLGDVTLVRRVASVRYLSTGYFGNDLMFLFQGTENRPCVNGIVIDQMRQVATSGDQEITNIFQADSDQLLVTVRRDSLARYLREDECALFLDTLRTLRFFTCDPAHKRAMATFFYKLLAHFEELGQSPPQDTSRACSQLIVDLLFHYVLSHRDLTQKKPRNRERVLARALSHLECHPDSDIEELAWHAHTSIRSLQYVFNDLLGIKPVHFRTILRLNRVHQEIVDLRGPLNVTRLAARHGFSNVHRLVEEYRQHFGEHPRETAGRKT